MGREHNEETIKRIEQIESDIENIKAILREILDALEGKQVWVIKEIKNQQ